MRISPIHSVLSSLLNSIGAPNPLGFHNLFFRLRTIFWSDKVCLLLFAAIVALLPSCQSLFGKTEISEAEISDILVKQNLVGEECRIQQVENLQQDSSVKRHFEIYCGRWERASGYIFEVRSDDVATPLDQWANSGWWSNWLNRKLQCEQGSDSSILGEVDAFVLQCKLRNGDWPYLALVTQAKRSTYLVDGIPAVYPVLEDGIGVLSGLLNEPSDSDDGSRSAVIQRITTQFKGGLYGAGDLRTYFRLMKAGQFYNSIKDFTTAANRYREALAIHERMQGDNNLGLLDPLMHLALEMSNQGRFSEAEALFKKALEYARLATQK